jgi:acetyltransferase-like isoleucine patch superfamily enzyme
VKKLPIFIRGLLRLRRYFLAVKNAVRIFVYRRLFSAQIGKDNYLSNLEINWPQQLILGDNLKLGKNVTIVVDGPIGYPGKINIGNNVEIIDLVRIKKNEQSIVIVGNGSFIGFGVEINVLQDLSIGKNVLIAAGVKITDVNHLYHPSFLPRIGHYKSKAISIEDDVWIGANGIILPGVTLGRGAVVAAGSVVTRSIPAWELWAGVPAKFIRYIGDKPQ